MKKQGRPLNINTIDEINTQNHWRDQALCQDQDFDLYFPQKHKNKTKYTSKHYYEAQLLCEYCPVKFECLSYSVQNRLTSGTFCLPATERKKIKATTNIYEFYQKVIKRRNNMDTKFKHDGSLDSKKCVQCHRVTRHYYFDSGGWSALRNNCVDCAISIQQNKKTYHRRYSESDPKFDNWGSLLSKVCTKCNKRNPANQYAKRVAGIGGRTSWCRKCVAHNTKEYEMRVNKDG